MPWRSAVDNVALPLELIGISGAETEQRAQELMALVGLTGFENSLPRDLSGGMAQRIAIARALIHGPDLLLLDEPFGSLDAMTRESLQNLLLELWKEEGFTYVLITHSIEEAVFLGNRIVILSPRPGRVVRVLDNPYMGEKGFRLSDSYHKMCSEIRRNMENLP